MIEFQALRPHALQGWQKKRRISFWPQRVPYNHGLIRTYLNLKPTFQRKTEQPRRRYHAYEWEGSILEGCPFSNRSVHLMHKNPSRIFCRFRQVTLKMYMEDFPGGQPAIAGDGTPGRSLMRRAAEPVSHNEGTPPSPIAAARGSTHSATKTQHSQKETSH